MRSKSKTVIALPLALILGFAAVYVLSSYLERNRVAMAAGYEDSDLELQGKRLKGFTLGAEGLLADWYWIKSLQYIGDKMVKSGDDSINIDDLTSLNPRLLYPYLDNATDLDPHFMPAYNYGATVLPAIDPELAVKLTEKGIVHNPDKWRLYHYLGYIYWRARDYQNASDAYDRGSQIAGAPPFMKMMSAAVRTEGGSRATARAIYTQMLAETGDESVRNSADKRVKELDSLDERDAIDKALEDAKERTGRCVDDLKEIVPMLARVSLPSGRDFRVDRSNRLVDPTGAQYLLDEVNCRVMLDVEKTKLPLK